MKVYGQLERAQIESVGALPAAGVRGRFVFLTTDSFLYFDDGTSFHVVASIDQTQTLTAKTISSSIINTSDLDGGTASDTSRLTIPKASKATLDGLTRKQATLLFASDQNSVYVDNGSSISPLGGNWTATANENISASGSISSSTVVGLQLRRVTGDGAAVTTSVTPFGAVGGWSDGLVVRLLGQSATNTVTIPHNDAAKGAILNGDCILGQHDMLELQYDSTADRWIEVARSIK